MDKISIERRSWNMSQIKSTDTKPELVVRSFLHKNGFRYRLNYKITGKPDIVFPKFKVSIFIHGCFWHIHGCDNSVIPKTNTKFWKEKLGKNVERDRIVEKTLKKDGWIVKKIWECELEKNPKKVLNKLLTFLNKLKKNY